MATKTKPKTKGITERPKGSGIFWVRWTAWEDGVARDRLKKIGKSYAEAVKFQERVLAGAREDKVFPELAAKKKQERDLARLASYTVNDAIDNYLALANVKPSTAQVDRYLAELWRDVFGRRSAAALKRADVEAWMLEHRQAHAENTVNNKIGFLRRALRRAVADGHIPADPIAGLRLFGGNKGKLRFLELAEKERLRALVGHVPDGHRRPVLTHVEWLAIEFAYRTGLRQAEQFGLTWDCVLIRRDGGPCSVVLPDTKAGVRQTAYLNRRAVEILEELRQIAAGSDYVFPGARGGPMDGHNFTHRVFKPALKAAKIKHFRWHDLRHTFGSDLARAGVPILDIQKLMRHADVRMTMRYAHLAPSHLAMAIEKVSIDA